MKTANSFPKKHRLCSRTLTEELFARGNSFFAWPFRCVYLLSDPPAAGHAPVQLLVSVSKKKHKKAVARNLVKRRTREAYRLGMDLWGAAFAKDGAYTEGKVVLFALVYSPGEVLGYRDIENGVRKAILSVKKRVEARGDTYSGGVD